MKKVTPLTNMARIFAYSIHSSPTGGKSANVREITNNDRLPNGLLAASLAEKIQLNHCALSIDTMDSSVETGYIHSLNMQLAQDALNFYYNGTQEAPTPCEAVVEFFAPNAEIKLNTGSYDAQGYAGRWSYYLILVPSDFTNAYSATELRMIMQHHSTRASVAAVLAEAAEKIPTNFLSASMQVTVTAAADPFDYTF